MTASLKDRAEPRDALAAFARDFGREQHIRVGGYCFDPDVTWTWILSSSANTCLRLCHVVRRRKA